MLKTRRLARLVTPALSMMMWQALPAADPAPATPPATSVREWKKPATTPAADAATTPTSPAATGPATSISAWQSNTAATPAANTAATGPAKSVREWNVKPAAAPAAKPGAVTPAAASPAVLPASAAPATPAAVPAAHTAVAKSPVAISLKSTLREGALVVLLDDVPIFNEKFHKPMLLMSQTTTWDPLQVPAGKHKLSAKVYGTKKTYFSATYDLDVSRTKASALRFVMQGDKLTVELAS